MKKRKKILFGISMLLLLGIAASAYIYKEYNRRHADTGKLNPDYLLTTTALLDQFAHDSAMSSQKYMDKLIQVSGVVKQIDRIDDQNVVVVMGNPDDRSAVRCSLDSSHQSEAMTLQTGQMVSVKGICSGYNQDELLGSDVILIRCVPVAQVLTGSKN